MAAPVIHFEIAGKDGKKLNEFYTQLFDWKVDANNPMEYGMVQTGGQGGIQGGIAKMTHGEPYVSVYVQVPDLEESLRKAESLGGKTIMRPMAVPGGPTIAMFTDPEGNKIGLVKT